MPIRLPRISGYATTVLATAAIVLIASAMTITASAETTVTTQVACQHLFIKLADGPHALSWAARANMLRESGLSLSEINLVIQAANVYSTAVARLTKQATDIHKDLRSKTPMAAANIETLKNLDVQREGFLSAGLDQLRIDLGPEATLKFESFLNDKVKPTITFVH